MEGAEKAKARERIEARNFSFAVVCFQKKRSRLHARVFFSFVRGGSGLFF